MRNGYQPVDNFDAIPSPPTSGSNITLPTTADVDEVVSCKYCKYRGQEEPNNMVYCPQFAGGLVSEDSFCSMWERRRRCQ